MSFQTRQVNFIYSCFLFRLSIFLNVLILTVTINIEVMTDYNQSLLQY